MDDDIRTLLYALADRVYAWSVDQEQPEDWRVLTMARMVGWQPWHERKGKN